MIGQVFLLTPILHASQNGVGAFCIFLKNKQYCETQLVETCVSLIG